MRWTATQGWRKTRLWCIESHLGAARLCAQGDDDFAAGWRLPVAPRDDTALALKAPVPFQDPATRQPGAQMPRLRAYPQVPRCPHCVQ